MPLCFIIITIGHYHLAPRLLQSLLNTSLQSTVFKFIFHIKTKYLYVP